MIKEHPHVKVPRVAHRLNERALARRNQQIAARIDVGRILQNNPDIIHVKNGIAQVDYNNPVHRQWAQEVMEEE